MKPDYHESCDDQNKVILQTLIDKTEDEDVKKVISCFTIDTTGAEIIKKMTALTMLPLKKAAHYLEIPERVLKSKLKAAIISDIVDRLNALLMEFCAICEEYYHEDLSEKPLVKCILCNQGCHNPCQEPIILRLSEFDTKQQLCRPFMCSSCISDHTEDDPDTNMAHARKNKKSPKKQIEKPTNNENNHPTAPNSPRQTNSGNDSNGDLENPSGRKTTQTPEPPQQNASVPVCPDYKWGRCPKYEECQFRHPPRCWSWLEKGQCSYNRNCRFHHPPLCYTSLWERQCYNQDCKYFHLQKTKRFKMEEEQLKTSLNAGNYQSQFPSLLPQSNENKVHPAHEPQMLPNTSQSRPGTYQSRLDHQPTIHHPPNFTQHPPAEIAQGSLIQPTSHIASRGTQPLNNKSPPESRFTTEDMSFLVKTIKEILKHEIGEIKQKLSPSVLAPPIHQQFQKPSLQQVSPHIQSQPLLQISPQLPNQNLYSLQVAPHQPASQ